MKIIDWFRRLFSQTPVKPLSKTQPEKTPEQEKTFLALCGHTTFKKGLVQAFGETSVCTMPFNAQGAFDWCLECIGKMIIQCAWCAKPIFIGDPVTLYTPAATKIMPPHAQLFEDGKSYVGCGRTTCADTGADYSGTWLPNERGKGYVKRYKSLIEIAMDAGKGVCAPDLTDRATIHLIDDPTDQPSK